MYAYSHLSQGDDETTIQYLVRAKFLLEHIHQTTKLEDIAGNNWDNLYLMDGTEGTAYQERAAMEQESWRTMEDVFQTIHCIPKTEEKIKAYSEPNFEPMPWMSTVTMHEVCFGKYAKPNSPVKNYNSKPQGNMQYSSNFRDGCKYHNNQFNKDQGKPQ